LLFHYLRIADYAAAQRVDYFLANSAYTQQRIMAYYRRKSLVIYPPIDSTFFTPNSGYSDSAAPGNYFLCVGRLSPMKYFDQAVHVCSKLGLPLVVIGRGSEKSKLRKLAGSSVTFLDGVDREELRNYYRGARALLQPGVEDFGMASAEAAACGTPTIGIDAGGAIEIIEDGMTGILYRNKSDEALADAMRRFIDLEYKFTPECLQRSVMGFSLRRWQVEMKERVSKAVLRVRRQSR